jgi:hypothetical protein
MPSTLSRARLAFAGLALPALALALACGGSSASPSASTSGNTPKPAPAAKEPDPFWADDSPNRPHRAHPIHPVSAAGPVVSLAPSEFEAMKAAAPAGTQTQAAFSAPATATPLRIVTGLYSVTYHQDNATTLQPQDLTSSPIVALVPNASGGFDTLPSVGHSDGTFSIMNVPVGFYFLKFGRSYLWTNSDSVEWIFDGYGRADSVYPATQPTNLALTASGLNTWQSTDELFWTVPNQGLTSSTTNLPGVTNPPSLGSASLSAFTMEFVQAGFPLLNATKGDQGYLTQLTSRSASGQTYRALGKVFNLPATTMADGATTAVSGGFLDIPQASTLHLAWKRSAFAAMTASVNPNATVVQTECGLWLSPLGTSVGIPSDAFQLFTYDSGDVNAATDLDLGDLPYGNPLPAAWTPIVETYFTWSVSYMAPGAGTPVHLLRSAYTATTALPTATAPLTPLLSPVQNPRINGKSLFQNQVGVGTAPTIAWDAPATGAPTGYVVSLYPLVNNSGASAFQGRFTFRTAARSFTVPPSVMAAGSTYVVVISAIRNPGYSYASNPFQTAFPYGTAPIASAIVAP